MRTYYDAPRGCLACLSYAHLFRNCPKKETVALCRKCGLNAGLNEEESKQLEKRVLRDHVCQVPPECPNCPIGRNAHRPTETICPARQREVEVIRIKTDHCLSYREARARVSDSFVTSHKSFAETVTRGATGPTQSAQTSQTAQAAERIAKNSATIASLKQLNEEEERQIAELTALESKLVSLRQNRLAREVRVAKLKQEAECPSQDPFGSVPMPSATHQTPEEDVMVVEEVEFVKPRPLSAKSRRENFSSGSSTETPPPNKAVKKIAESTPRAQYKSIADADLAYHLKVRQNTAFMEFKPVSSEHVPQSAALTQKQTEMVVKKLSEQEAAAYERAIQAAPHRGKKSTKPS